VDLQPRTASTIARQANDMICRATAANVQYPEHFSRSPWLIKDRRPDFRCGDQG
jgi:hypothetical protein